LLRDSGAVGLCGALEPCEAPAVERREIIAIEQALLGASEGAPPPSQVTIASDGEPLDGVRGRLRVDYQHAIGPATFNAIRRLALSPRPPASLHQRARRDDGVSQAPRAHDFRRHPG